MNENESNLHRQWGDRSVNQSRKETQQIESNALIITM